MLEPMLAALGGLGLERSLTMYRDLSPSVSACHICTRRASLSSIVRSAGRNGRCSRRKLDAGTPPASPLTPLAACSAFQKRLRQLVNLPEGGTPSGAGGDAVR